MKSFASIVKTIIGGDFAKVVAEEFASIARAHAEEYSSEFNI